MTALTLIDGAADRPPSTPGARSLRRSILKLRTFRVNLHRQDEDATPEQAWLVAEVDREIATAIVMMQTLLAEELAR